MENPSQLFRLSSKARVQNTEFTRTSEHINRSKVQESQAQTLSSKTMSLQRSSTLAFQQHEGEHLGTLHARLHQEADKIRKWKIQTELDLKDKEKKLTEASSQIDIMKKSLLELQLENERTSARLQEETSCREDVIKRINGTRQMCNLLQSHASKMEGQLLKCETERTELKYVGKENMQRIEEVTSLFKNLQITLAENNKKLQNQATAERSDRMQTEMAWKTKVDESETEVQNLRQALEDKKNEMSELQDQVKEREKKLEEMEHSTDSLQNKVTKLSEELIHREEELKESSLRISSIQDEKSKMEKMMKEMEQEFNSLQMTKDNMALDMTEARRKLEEQLQLAQQDAHDTKAILAEEKNKLESCETQLSKSKALVENLKSMKDSVILEKADTEMQLDLQKFQVANLLAEKADDKEEIHQLNGEIAVLTAKLDRENLCKVKAQEEVEALQEKVSLLELDRHDQQERIASMEKALHVKQEKIQSLESLLSEEEEKTIRLQNRVDKLEQEHATNREHMQEVEEQIFELKDNVSKKEHKINQKNQELEDTQTKLKNLNSAIQEKDKQRNDLVTEQEVLRSKIADQNDIIEDLTSQLNDVTQEREKTGQSLSSQQKKFESTLKQNKELEKEVKTLKTKLEAEYKTAKSYEDKLDKLKGELNNAKQMKADAEDSFHKCQDEMQKVKHRCQEDQNAARLAMKKAEEMEASAQREKQNALALTDCQLAEMMATLDTYKQNNEKLLVEKDKEIHSLQTELEHANSLSNVHERELLSLRDEMERLKQKVSSSGKETKSVDSKAKDKRVLHKESSSKLLTPTKKATLQTPDVSETKSQQSPMQVTHSPQKQIPRTPAPVTPAFSTLKTPQHSILRACNSVTKKRRVTIQPDATSPPSSSEESDLMELDTETAASGKARTPLFPKSPSRAKTLEYTSRSTPKTTVSSAGRNKNSTPASVRQASGDSYTQEKSSVELDGNYFSSKTNRNSTAKKSETHNEDKPGNLRKTPAKKVSKVFTTSPRKRSTGPKTKLKEKGSSENTGQLAWFELDSVYGFGPED